MSWTISLCVALTTIMASIEFASCQDPIPSDARPMNEAGLILDWLVCGPFPYQGRMVDEGEASYHQRRRPTRLPRIPRPV